MITDNKRVDFGPLFLRDAPDVRKAGGNMSRRDEYEQKAEALLAPIVEGQGFELVDVEYVKEAGNWYLRGYIDKPGGIMVDDCEAVSRELSDILDEQDFIEESYILEVSSPGLLRPFKKPKDYQRNLGDDVEVKLFAPITFEQKGKKFTDKEFIGILKSYEAPQEDSTNGGKIVLGFGEDDTLEIEIKDIALIRKSIDF